MENKNNGQGIFYGVIGVATLVVAIIGATFAYFSATTNSDVDEIQAGSTGVSLSWADSGTTGIKENLIPVDASDDKFNSYPGLTDDDCKDVNGNDICSVYEFTVTNPEGNAAQRVYASLKPVKNTFTNLHFTIFKGTADAISKTTKKFDVNGTEVASPSNATKNTYGVAGDVVHGDTQLVLNNTDSITLTKLEQVLDGGESVTYTMVIWLNEEGEGNSVDQNKEFTAGITFTTAGGGSGVTGVLAG